MRRTGRAVLTARRNRIRSSIDFRIVATATREWAASDTVVLDDVFDDDSRSETQVNAFLRRAALEVTTSALRKLAGELTIERVEESTGGQILRVSGGSAAGLRVGERYRVGTHDIASAATTIEITEVFPAYAVARNAGAPLAAGNAFAPSPLSVEPAVAAGDRPVRVGLMPCLENNTKPFDEAFLVSIRNSLALYMQDYDGVEMVEDRTVFRDAVLGQQLLDDLSKGREVGLPLGSLRGVDYLIVCTIESVDVVAGGETVETVYGARTVNRTGARVRTRGSTYIIDVNSAVGAEGSRIDTTVILDPGDEGIVDAADRVAQDMFGALMIGMRPLAIARVGGGRLTLNHKQSVGVRVDEEYLVYSPGEDIEDTMTGEVLRNIGGAQVGRLRVVGFDAAGWIQAEMTDGGEARAGYLLRRTNDRARRRERASGETVVW